MCLKSQNSRNGAEGSRRLIRERVVELYRVFNDEHSLFTNSFTGVFAALKFVNITNTLDLNEIERVKAYTSKVVMFIKYLHKLN